jgi:hypothetical protein
MNGAGSQRRCARPPIDSDTMPAVLTSRLTSKRSPRVPLRA